MLLPALNERQCFWAFSTLEELVQVSCAHAWLSWNCFPGSRNTSDTNNQVSCGHKYIHPMEIELKGPHCSLCFLPPMLNRSNKIHLRPPRPRPTPQHRWARLKPQWPRESKTSLGNQARRKAWRAQIRHRFCRNNITKGLWNDSRCLKTRFWESSCARF